MQNFELFHDLEILCTWDKKVYNSSQLFSDSTLKISYKESKMKSFQGLYSNYYHGYWLRSIRATRVCRYKALRFMLFVVKKIYIFIFQSWKDESDKYN